uniref:Uncharacterized protein n=1 Tax=Candidatus Kentrum sp. LFY TaxID=2126342 RepID=A0A450UBM6_9GAMM|nr:MAG: hypothetical protein BECKLFY1418B_GA0070995_101622 [Candidatus Kentron sp. LFY]VFJ93989.1 MAG: hypothetical protein BECKLFY1418A_GA0070994_10361 [Candidatus Kentron sp. LFY]
MKNELDPKLYSRVSRGEHSKQLKAWQLVTAGPHQLMIYPRITLELEQLLTPTSLLGEFGSGVG